VYATTKDLLKKKFENVSEGGLEHPFEWYITETVIYHRSKLTRQGPSGAGIPRASSGGAAGPHDQSECLTWGNDDCG